MYFKKINLKEDNIHEYYLLLFSATTYANNTRVNVTF